MKVFKRGRVYWFKLQFEGKLYQKSTKQRNKGEAEGAAAAFRTALANRNFGIIERKASPIFEDAMKSFLAWSKGEHKEHPATYLRYKTSSKALLAYFKFKSKPVDQITPATIEEFKTHRARQSGKRTKRPIKPATINRELACLKAMYFHVLKDRHDFRNPVSEIDLLPENNEQDRVLTFDEQRTYLKTASDNLRDVATLILETGMRPEEVYRARVDNVNLEENYLFNPYGKTKAARRRVPLNSVARAIVKRRVEAAKGPYLFAHKKYKDKAMLKANNAHTTALKNSKVRPFRLYDLRHTWATRAAEAGVDVGTLASLLGHSKLVMVMRYVHPGEAHRADAVKNLEAMNAVKEIAEFEKQKAEQKRLATLSDTVPENPAKFSDEKTEGKSQRIN